MPKKQKENTWMRTVLDSLQNLVSGMGVSTRDKRYSTRHQHPGTISQVEEEYVFRGDSIGQRIFAKPARDMVRNWLEIQSSMEMEQYEELIKLMADLQVKKCFREAITWARKSGAGLIYMGINDGFSTTPDMPVNESSIRSIDWLKPLEKHDVRIHSTYTTPGKNFGEPEYYEFPNSKGESVIIHESRMLRFDGTLTTDSQKRANGGWSDSVLVALIEPLRDTGAAFNGLMAILAEGPQAVFKIQGLSSKLASSEDVLERIAVIDLLRSQFRAIPLDAEHESYERIGVSIDGISESIDRAMIYLSACSGIPVTVLWGRSPAGFNATGASDLEIYYNWIKEQQEEQIRPNFSMLLRYILLSKDGPTNGQLPESWDYVFAPLWSPTEKEVVELRRSQANTDKVYINSNVLLPEEVRRSRFSGLWSKETFLDQALYDEKKEEFEKKKEFEEKDGNEETGDIEDFEDDSGGGE